MSRLRLSCAPAGSARLCRGRAHALFAFLLVLATLAGCRDTLRPELRGATLRIFLGAAPFDEITVPVGDVIQLSGRILDERGRTVEGETIEWSSDAPDIATVDAAGGVQTLTVGTVRIVARHRIGADTAVVNVAEYVSLSQPCTEAEAVRMTVGEVREFSGPEASRICLGGGDAGANFTAVVVNTGQTAASTLNLQVRTTGMAHVPAGATPNPARLPVGAAGDPRMDEAFHHRIRADASRALEPRLRAGATVPAVETPRLQAAPGQLVEFNVSTGSACNAADVQTRTGRIREVSQRAIVVADTLNPAGGFTDADYSAFALFFDTHVWPLVTGAFGEPSDIDGNRRVHLFFTRAVNELPANAASQNASGAYVGGFFFNRDLFSRNDRSQPCAGSNEAEMFYLLVPEPTPPPASGRRAFSRDFLLRSTPTVIVHEFQHLVNDSRRLHVNRAPVWEETWLNEGLSHIAEELMFYREANLSPRSKLGPDALSTPQTQEAFRRFQMDNVERLTLYLNAPENNSLMGQDILPTRGATWAFLRYAADRTGAEGALWHTLVRDARSGGLANLRQALPGDPAEWIRDWAVAMYAADTGLTEDARYRMPSYDFRALYPRLDLVGGFAQRYPLRVSSIGSGLGGGATANFGLRGGGAGYVRTRANAGTVGVLRVNVGPASGLSQTNQLPPPTRVRVVVVRTG